MDEYRPLARRDELIVRRLDDEVLIYDRRRERAHCLNETAGLVWGWCDGQRTVQEIAGALAAHTGTESDCEVVHFALARLAQDDLLAPSTRAAPQALSRRQLIQRLGIAAAALAIPAVTSIASPTAALAGSTKAPGTPCQSSFECSGGLCVNGTCQ